MFGGIRQIQVKKYSAARATRAAMVLPRMGSSWGCAGNN
jgi:hypothetical protein